MSLATTWGTMDFASTSTSTAAANADMTEASGRSTKRGDSLARSMSLDRKPGSSSLRLTKRSATSMTRAVALSRPLCAASEVGAAVARVSQKSVITREPGDIERRAHACLRRIGAGFRPNLFVRVLESAPQPREDLTAPLDARVAHVGLHGRLRARRGDGS